MRWWAQAALGVATVTSLESFARIVAADEKQACVAASEKAQQLRNGGKLEAAREQLLACGRSECPKVVREDCTQWMTEVLAIVPSVVPGAKDKKGRDVIDTKVAIDGKTVTDTLDGKAFNVDPGVHTLRFETKGAPPVEEQIVVRQGEKNRIVTVTFALGDDVAPKQAPRQPTSETETTKGTSSFPVAAVIVGGLGLVAGGIALYIDLDANADARRLRDTCSPRCDQKDVDDVQNRYTIAGVTAGIGGALLVAGVVLFILHGRGGGASARREHPLVVGARADGRGAATSFPF